MTHLPEEALKTLFLEARTLRSWRDQGVDEALLRQLYELTALGPTSLNSCPIRIVFVRSPEAKERLVPALTPGNVEKTRGAPVTAILAYDGEWWEQLEHLAPGRDLKAQVLTESSEKRESDGRNNGWLEGGYFLLAARSLGLDVGPMGGFSREQVDQEFLGGTPWRSFLLVNLGYGDPSTLRPRAPRLPFDRGARIL